MKIYHAHAHSQALSMNPRRENVKIKNSFYRATAMRRAVYAVVVCLCVCVSVCLSVTLRYCIKTAKRKIVQTTPHDSPMTLFSDAKDHGEIRTRSPLRGRQMQVGWVKIRYFRRKTSYNSKTVQDRRIVFIKVE